VRPKEMLDRRKFGAIRRNICDRELTEFRPRRLEPPPPDRGVPALPIIEPPAPAATERIIDAAPLADLLASIKAPDATDVRRRAGRWHIEYRRLHHTRDI
jgi:hypothetical protein